MLIYHLTLEEKCHGYDSEKIKKLRYIAEKISISKDLYAILLYLL